MEAPLVSVNMLTYNHEPYIAQAIEGVLAQQTDFGVELVIGEDCSTDRTAEICQDYAERYPGRIRLLTQAHNLGMRANNRRTLEACRGRYIAICDGDDYWSDPRKLQMQVDAMEADPACGLCHTCAEVLDQQTGSRKPYLKYDPHPSEFDRMMFYTPVCAPTALVRRELIERYYAEVAPERFPQWLADDAPMWLFVASQSKLLWLEATTTVYRVLPSSASHFPAYRKQIAFEDSIWDIRRWFDLHYGRGTHVWKIRRRRAFTAWDILARSGTRGEFVRRWCSDVCHTPRLLSNTESYRRFFGRAVLGRRE